MTETPPPLVAPGPEPEAPEPTVDLQAEVERLLAENEALQFSEAEAHDAVERLTAELDRAGGPPPDGEMRRTVKWWRVLSEDERERYEWRLPVEACRWCKSDPSHFGDHCVIYVRERPTPEPPPVEAGQWRRKALSGPRFVIDVTDMLCRTVGRWADSENGWHLAIDTMTTVASWPLCDPDPRWPVPAPTEDDGEAACTCDGRNYNDPTGHISGCPRYDGEATP